MTTWPKQSDKAAMEALFGCPDANGDGAPDPAWVRDHLTTIIPPYPLFYGASQVRKLTCNKAIAEPLTECFVDILGLYRTQEAIHAHGMDQFSGCYNFRPKRGGSSLSMHAYGAAVDLDAPHNPFRSHKFSMPAEVVAIFKKHGAVWGGDWTPGSRDAMHFQWPRVK